MKKSPQFLLWFIILLTILGIVVNLPSKGFLSFTKSLSFKEGLDLAGGTSLTLKADMKSIDQAQRGKALESAKTVIEQRTNYFGVSEPIVQTAVSGNDYRVIVELPGVNIDQAKNIIGTTAQLSFWEGTATSSSVSVKTQADIQLLVATQSAYPPSVVLALGTYPSKTDLSGADLKETSVGFDQNSGKPEVQLKFTSQGAKKFADITSRNVGKIVAIALDNQVIEAPRVNQPILTGDAVITGGFTTQTANAVSKSLNAGALPVPLVYLQQHGVEATLGRESLLKSLFAGVLGILIIIIFMTVLYGKLGIIASVALIIYTLLVASILKISSVTPYAITLTLSGIAGFILSIGMAVDANILIFERMKEERRSGRSWHESLELGFTRAWTSIRDSNISSLITCSVLYQFGTGSVKGFALTLAIGVLVSMFSAIVVTRTLLNVMLNSFQHPVPKETGS
ncbi:MAG: protein-export membrane protein SecD [Candidatus Levybacteria bacterium RIFCSPLOWO2_01_FULL_39_24]|nr:MAG: protein-export membrane protein SecD [Candidatus Levybacteria bacterium RIFCSPHIGHO2_01_FULL_40_16]OGH28635.1 MAG: protein-export membrane protein SecD [Candidatus Levybacteria bacterium RIFCSPHIGHO2_12_FULL_39_9]OGH46024.1 MAG: protein-export membrane protein SecD [Candidatus Levybacteria bacterium RIFCSPLOWO2_01_FULL_39_24]